MQDEQLGQHWFRTASLKSRASTTKEDEMLGKMMIHGVVAAILIAGAAAVYAQAKDGGSLSAAPAGTGYLKPTDGGFREHRDGRKHADRADRQRDGHDRDHQDRDGSHRRHRGSDRDASHND